LESFLFMTATSPSAEDVWRSGVIPTVAALVATGVMIVERMQVDWTADCSVPGICNALQTNMSGGELLSGLTGLLIFSILHAALRRHPAAIAPAVPDRMARVMIFALGSLYPFFGWYLLYVGIGIGFLTAVTIIGLVVAIPAGVIGAAWFGGIVLGLAAGPSFTAGWTIWRKHLLCYANAAAIAGTLLVLAQFAFDPQFSRLGPVQPWFNAAGLLIATGLACCVVWISGLTNRWFVPRFENSPNMRRAVMAVASGVLAVLIPTVGGIAAGFKPLDALGEWSAPATAFVRGYKPPSGARLQLAGLEYIGPRSGIIAQGGQRRDRLMSEYDATTGTRRGWTVTDRVVLWRIAPPVDRQQEVHVVADEGGTPENLHCLPLENTRRMCTQDPFAARDQMPESVKRRVGFGGEEAYELSVSMDNAALGVRWDVRKRTEGMMRPQDWPRLYCRIVLIDVTPARLSVHQLWPCDALWEAQAELLQTYTEGLFRPASIQLPQASGSQR
jgi:hypothetical protein